MTIRINNPKIKKVSKESIKQLPNDKIKSLQSLFQQAEAAYLSNKPTKVDRLNQKISEQGTRKDKISIVVNQIISNPDSCLENFSIIIGWCFDQNTNFALRACKSLTQIYTNNLFSEKTLLKSFSDSVHQYFLDNKKNKTIPKSELVSFYIQQRIKSAFAELVRGVQKLLQSTVNYVRKQSIKILSELAKYQQLRRTTISMIINKLGDNDKEIVNEVVKNLKTLFYEDISLFSVLLEQVQQFLFRPNLSSNTQFYVINFLNSINLKYLNQKNMMRMFDIFFSLFKKCINDHTDESYGSRLFLNLTKGLNKIFAYLKGIKTTHQSLKQKIQSIYKIFHQTKNPKTKIQLLLFLFQTHSHLNGSLPDRFYRVLYDLLGSDVPSQCSLTEVFIDILMISIKQDQNLNRSFAFLKRALQQAFTAQPNFIITTLIMISRILQENTALAILLKQTQNSLKEENINKVFYDQFKREPCFCGAQDTLLWQLRIYLTHYHPTVRKYTQCILKGQKIDYQGENPLSQYNSTSFIQKISLRKQRKSQSWRLKKSGKIKMEPNTLVTDLNREYQEDQLFIKSYLQKRSKIHPPREKITQDIQDYADQVIEDEMDKLNPEGDSLQFTQSNQHSGEGSQIYHDDDDDQLQQGNQFDNQEGQSFEIQGEDEDGEEIQQFSQNNLNDQSEYSQPHSQKQFEEVFQQIAEEDSQQKWKKQKKSGNSKPKINNKPRIMGKKIKKNNFTKSKKLKR